jgi:transposase-like protein
MSYKERDKTLLDMGYASYSDYLSGDLWVAIRTKNLKRCGFRCRVCGEPTTILHHTSYEVSVLQGRNNKKLVALCEAHHHSIEFREDGTKTSHIEANRNLSLLLKDGVAILKRTKKKKHIKVSTKSKEPKTEKTSSYYCYRCDKSFTVSLGQPIKLSPCPYCKRAGRKYIFASKSVYLVKRDKIKKQNPVNKQRIEERHIKDIERSKKSEERILELSKLPRQDMSLPPLARFLRG